MSEADAAAVFRPSWSGFHRRLWARWALLLPLTVLLVVIAAGPQIGFALIILGIPLVVGGLYASVYFDRAKLWFEPGTVHLRSALRTRAWSVADIAHLVFVPQPLGRPGQKPPATLYAVTHLGERLFWLTGDAWERVDQDAIAARIGAPLHEVPIGLSPKEIAERFPGTIGWTALRPWLFALVVTASAFIALAVLTIIVTAIMIATGQVTLPMPTPVPTPTPTP